MHLAKIGRNLLAERGRLFLETRIESGERCAWAGFGGHSYDMKSAVSRNLLTYLRD